MGPVRRLGLTGLLAFSIVFFVSGVFAPGLALWWRAISVVGLVSGLLGIRTLWGAVVVVEQRGLRIQRAWPHRRVIRWFRVLQIDVVPGFWNLEVELNSGERVELPCVERLDELYESMEQHRQALDA
jgi:hypothetical protein